MTSGASDTVLQRLLRGLAGPPPEVLRDALALLASLSGAEAAYLAEPADGTWTVLAAAKADGLWVADPALVLVDVAASVCLDPQDPSRGRLGVMRPQGGVLDARDVRLLEELAPVVRPLAAMLGAGPESPDDSTLIDLERLAEAIDEAVDLESLSRPLLAALHALTGMASTYLTVIHEETGEQEIRYALNTREGFALPEGLYVAWADTLCKRALDEGQACTTDVPAVWGDSEAARDLGIQVYVSVPVQLSTGEVWGTLCAADSRRAEGVERHLPTMRMFSRLMAADVERSRAVTRADARARAAEQAARTDPLTGVASRAVVEPWLEQQFLRREEGETVLLAFVDVDDFKMVNDTLGHAAGDAVLVELGRVLGAISRPGDLVARFGGDEFILGALLPVAAVPGLAARLAVLSPLQVELNGERHRARVSVGVVTAQDLAVETAESLLAAADRAMYVTKRR